jgi:hypothetical protein
MLLTVSVAAEVLSPAPFARHIEKFNAMEPETVVNLVPNAQAWGWLKQNVPYFECADPAVEEIYWFRWWALRKHLRLDPATGRHVFTEFITRARPVSSGLGHHLMEGRWLREQRWHDDYVLYWLRGKDGRPQDHLHKFSQWLDHALWSRWLVTQDTATLTGLLDDLVAEYRRWEAEQGRPDGLFWQFDVRDAMEESISGGRKVKNVRPTISVYMYGNATALAAVARLAGREELAKEFDAKAAHLRRLVQDTLWNRELGFFGSVTEQLEPISVRPAAVSRWRGNRSPTKKVSRRHGGSRPRSGVTRSFAVTAPVRANGTARCGRTPPRKRSRRWETCCATTGRTR